MSTPRIRELIQMRDPWRFKKGDMLFVKGWSQDQPVQVLSQQHLTAFPHYEVQDCVGGCWLISQLNLSINPILERKS